MSNLSIYSIILATKVVGPVSLPVGPVPPLPATNVAPVFADLASSAATKAVVNVPNQEVSVPNNFAALTVVLIPVMKEKSAATSLVELVFPRAAAFVPWNFVEPNAETTNVHWDRSAAMSPVALVSNPAVPAPKKCVYPAVPKPVAVHAVSEMINRPVLLASRPKLTIFFFLRYSRGLQTCHLWGRNV